MILHYKYEVVIFLSFLLPRNKDVELYEAVRACTNRIIYAKFSLTLLSQVCRDLAIGV